MRFTDEQGREIGIPGMPPPNPTFGNAPPPRSWYGNSLGGGSGLMGSTYRPGGISPYGTRSLGGLLGSSRTANLSDRGGVRPGWMPPSPVHQMSQEERNALGAQQGPRNAALAGYYQGH